MFDMHILSPSNSTIYLNCNIPLSAPSVPPSLAPSPPPPGAGGPGGARPRGALHRGRHRGGGPRRALHREAGAWTPLPPRRGPRSPHSSIPASFRGGGREGQPLHSLTRLSRATQRRAHRGGGWHLIAWGMRPGGSDHAPAGPVRLPSEMTRRHGEGGGGGIGEARSQPPPRGSSGWDNSVR